MASFTCFSSSTYHTSQNPRKLLRKNPRFRSSFSSTSSCLSSPTNKAFPLTFRGPNTIIFRCQSRPDSQSSDGDFIRPRWDSLLHDALENALKRWKDYVAWNRIPLNGVVVDEAAAAETGKERNEEEEEEEGGDWDWDRWSRHFKEVEEQERILSILKLQLCDAVQREDYEDAAKLKVAVATSARHDTVGRAISYLKRAVEEERYEDAAFIRDHAGAGLVGWWAGISEDSADPYGKIIHIRADHGRYVARSYTSRQLATATPGVPLFEVFFTVNDKGEYKQQAVYLKWNRGNSGELLTKSLKPYDSTHLNSLEEMVGEKMDLSAASADDTEEIEESDGDSDVTDEVERNGDSDVVEEVERDGDSNVAEEVADSWSTVRGMMPGFKFNVAKLAEPGKIELELFYKVVEKKLMEEGKDIDFGFVEPDGQLKADETVEPDDELKAKLEEEDEENDIDFGSVESNDEIKADESVEPDDELKADESVEPDDELKAKLEEEDEEKDIDFDSVESDDELKAESDRDEIEMDAGGAVGDTTKEQSKLAMKIVIGTLAQNLPSIASPKDFLKVPARIEKRGRLSFSFSVKKDGNKQDPGRKGQALSDTSTTLPDQCNSNRVLSDLAKVLFSKERNPKISMKVLKDVGELLNHTLNQAQTRQSLSGSTVFNRIEIPTTSDPLNGLYGARGLHSEIIHLRRKFGQWQDDNEIRTSSNLEFYEYVEALKLTGDPCVPAGQVAFRAKIGKRNELPHKGIFPEELGVVARYRGQGRLAESGFQNPRWVDGELVILNGKYIKDGPVVGFIYRAPYYHFLAAFNRLKLQD
ncbi:hypothetical protein AAC387_Pa05g1710 [Persea americana]